MIGCNSLATLKQAVNYPLADCAASANFFLADVRVHVLCFAADESFVRLNRAGQLAECSRRHRFANPMPHEPCRLLGDVQCAPKLVTADSVLRVGDAPDSGKPLVKSEWAILENRANLIAELFFASPAFQNGPRRKLANVFATASRADDLAFRPFDRAHVSVGDGRIGEVTDSFD